MTDMRHSGSGAAVAVNPQLDEITPAQGPSSGRQKVAITGTGLADIVRVQFGQQFATNLDVIDSTRLTCIIPPNSPGRVPVVCITRTNRESNALEFDYS
jgi:IPT/TIG domain-containing protein